MGVDFDRYRNLSPEKQSLINFWFREAWNKKNCNETQCFYPFISAWIAFNSWAACITEEDQDSKMIEVLGKNKELEEDFKELLNNNPLFRVKVENFYKNLPIVKVHQIRKLEREIREIQGKLNDKCQKTKNKLNKWQIPTDSKPIDIEEIFKARFNQVKNERKSGAELCKSLGKELFSPKCWIEHQNDFDKIERNCINTLQSLYGVRCNLFHGEKSPLVTADQQIVLDAFLVMLYFFYKIFSKYGVIQAESYDEWL
jgi:hypothetical protein